MAKIPVGATIAQAWRFVVRDFLNILGVMAPALIASWLPSFLTRGQAMAANPALPDPARMTHLIPVFLCFYLLFLVLFPMQLIGIAQLALGTKKAPRWFHFSFAWPTWRLLGSILFVLLLVIIGGLAAVLADVVLSAVVKATLGGQAAGWAVALKGAILLIGSIAIWCAFFYALVRLTFLLVPVIAAQEPGFAVARSWMLGQGNFWRMLALILTVWLPLIVLETALVFGLLFQGISFPAHNAPPDQATAFQAALQARMLHMVNGVYDHWYITFPIFALVMVVIYGFAIGTQVFAWRALASDPIPGNALPD